MTSHERSEHILYGAPHSLYTGKVRSYLRQQGISFRELLPSHPSYLERIAPIIGRNIIPVLVTPDGRIVQDSIDIVDHFETAGVPYPVYPSGPLQHVLAIIIEHYANQSLLKHAMHYRWSYRSEQARFLEHAFAGRAPNGSAQKVMARMQSYLPQLGVTAATIPSIENSYARLLEILDVHFGEHPYLFGGRASIGDLGMIGPMFAHLGRDPVPAGIMKSCAPNVLRWIERMMAPYPDAPEFRDYPPEFLANDAVPATLEPLFAQIAEELFPELEDKLGFLDRWVAERRPRDGEPVSEKPHQRRIGLVASNFRGVPITVGVEPYLIYTLRRADRLLVALDAVEHARVREGLAQRGLQRALLGYRGYSVDRRDHIEVWQLEARS